jgi:hypothetical protein
LETKTNSRGCLTATLRNEDPPMKTVHMSLPLLLLSSVLLAQGPKDPDVAIGFDYPFMRFAVRGHEEQFLGAAIVSLSSNLVQVPGLPPLLENALLVDAGIANRAVFVASAQQVLFPPGLFIYVQGVMLDGDVWRSSPVREFVLDVTVPR